MEAVVGHRPREAPLRFKPSKYAWKPTKSTSKPLTMRETLSKVMVVLGVKSASMGKGPLPGALKAGSAYGKAANSGGCGEGKGMPTPDLRD